MAVAIVEDDEEIRASLTHRIDGHPAFQLVCTYPDAESTLTDPPLRKPEVVLMDSNLPGMDGAECVRRLKPKMPGVQFIMLTVHEDNNRLFKSPVAGASGYLSKRPPPAKLLAAITEVCEGSSPMTLQIARRVVQHFRQVLESSSEVEKLTSREKDVLEQLSREFRYKEIVGNLGISHGTFHGYIRNIHKKLRVHSRTEAVVKYLNR